MRSCAPPASCIARASRTSTGSAPSAGPFSTRTVGPQRGCRRSVAPIRRGWQRTFFSRLARRTGFEAHAYMRPMQITGPEGYTLDEAWRDGPRAHITTMIPGLPNPFMLMGPNSPIGNASLVPIAEVQADFVVGWLERMRDHAVSEVQPRADATARFYRDVKAAMTGTVRVTGCGSWYLGPDGVPVLWPWTLKEFRRRVANPVLADYAVRTTPRTTGAQHRAVPVTTDSERWLLGRLSSAGECQGSTEVTVNHQPKHGQPSPEDQTSRISRRNTSS